MTPEQNETLARLVGWELQHDELQPGGNPGFLDVWRKPGEGDNLVCPDMTTPNAMVELLEFCRKREAFFEIYGGDKKRWPLWEVKAGTGQADPDVRVDVANLPTAVALAVLALHKHGYLDEPAKEEAPHA